MSSTIDTVRRFLVVLVFGIWIGGLTFYALVVIPTGQHILHSHLKVGFITERVTQRLNGIGVAALAVLLWNVLMARDSAGRHAWRWLLGTWALLALLQAALFLLHPALGRLLDHEAREVRDKPGFYGIHRVYLIVTTVQWAGALVHLALVLTWWRQKDARAIPS